ncbi:MAG: tRNA lysidine(34) synthetase TilS [Gammaproteobacteria bacterium]
MEFSPANLLDVLKSFPPVRRLCVAYSGGLDSQVLLHALHGLRGHLAGSLAVVHVDHGLHDDAKAWVQRCRQVCERLGVPFAVLTVDGKAGPGQSPEAAARQVRYQALAHWLKEGDCLLTAHHEDDQAETVILQMLRGSGPLGLAAMPLLCSLGPAYHGRPLLYFCRAQLLAYAKDHGLDWIEDPSNQQCHLDRNRLRHEIIPKLRERWPSIGTTLARVADNQAEAAYLLDELAQLDLMGMEGSVANTLSVAGLTGLDTRRCRNLLRYWFRLRGLPVPSRAVLKCVDKDVLRARWDGMPRVVWPGGEVRRYRDLLYAFRPLPHHDPTQRVTWEPGEPLQLPSAGGVLHGESVVGEGLKNQHCAGPLAIRFRHGGERCRPVGRRHHHRLKHLFQERGVPPWERDRTPLIYIGDQLAAIAGLWVCEPFQAGPEEAGLRIRWQREESPRS